MNKRYSFLLSLILGSGLAIAQSTPAQNQSDSDSQQAPAAQDSQQGPKVKVKVTPGTDQPEVVQPVPMSTGSGADTHAKKTPDKAMAYYHYTLAHMYEEL